MRCASGCVVGFANRALETALPFSANLDEMRRGFRAGICAGLDLHWFGSDEISPPPRSAVEHFGCHFGHIRKKLSFHAHEST
jgi:hypothetical protein